MKTPHQAVRDAFFRIHEAVTDLLLVFDDSGDKREEAEARKLQNSVLNSEKSIFGGDEYPPNNLFPKGFTLLPDRRADKTVKDKHHESAYDPDQPYFRKD